MATAFKTFTALEPKSFHFLVALGWLLGCLGLRGGWVRFAAWGYDDGVLACRAEVEDGVAVRFGFGWLVVCGCWGV